MGEGAPRSRLEYGTHLPADGPDGVYGLCYTAQDGFRVQPRQSSLTSNVYL